MVTNNTSKDLWHPVLTRATCGRLHFGSVAADNAECLLLRTSGHTKHPIPFWQLRPQFVLNRLAGKSKACTIACRFCLHVIQPIVISQNGRCLSRKLSRSWLAVWATQLEAVPTQMLQQGSNRAQPVLHILALAPPKGSYKGHLGEAHESSTGGCHVENGPVVP